MRKKITLYVLVISINLWLFSFFSYALSASSAVVIIADTKEVLYEKDAKRKMSMASTTKIMTALLACESGKLNDIVTVTDKMVRVEGTSMGLRAGDKLTLFNIVKGMMLLSGNDAANAVAFYLCGSLEDFSDLMNQKAAEIRMTDTHFVTPSGLDDDEHYSTAYDMAVLSAYAMKNPDFRKCVENYSGSVEYVYPAASYTYRNHNRFLTMYDGACGIKTGFTKKSGRCLVSAVEKDGCLVIAVTLNAPDDWNDHIFLYDSCLSEIKTHIYNDDFNCLIKVAGGCKSVVSASVYGTIETYSADFEFKTVLYTEKFVYAPVEKGDILGSVKVFCNDDIIDEYPLTADESVSFKYETDSKNKISYKIKELFRRFKRWLITA